MRRETGEGEEHAEWPRGAGSAGRGWGNATRGPRPRTEIYGWKKWDRREARRRRSHTPPDASHPASRPPLGADSHHPSLVDMSYRLTQISMLMRTMMIHSSVSDLRFCKISR